MKEILDFEYLINTNPNRYDLLCSYLLDIQDKKETSKVLKIINEIKSDNDIKELMEHRSFYPIDLVHAFAEQNLWIPSGDPPYADYEQLKIIKDKWGDRSLAELARILDYCSKHPKKINTVIEILDKNKEIDTYNKIYKKISDDKKVKLLFGNNVEEKERRQYLYLNDLCRTIRYTDSSGVEQNVLDKNSYLTIDKYKLYSEIYSATPYRNRVFLFENTVRLFNENEVDANLWKIMRDYYLENPQKFFKHIKIYKTCRTIINELINGDIDVYVDKICGNEESELFLLNPDILTSCMASCQGESSTLKEIKEKIVKRIVIKIYGEKRGSSIIDNIDFENLNIQDFYRFSLLCRYLLDKAIKAPAFLKFFISFFRYLLDKPDREYISKVIKIINETKSDDDIKGLITHRSFYSVDLALAFIGQDLRIPSGVLPYADYKQLKKIKDKWGYRSVAELARILDFCSKDPKKVNLVIKILNDIKIDTYDKVYKIISDNEQVRCLFGDNVAESVRKQYIYLNDLCRTLRYIDANGKEQKVLSEHKYLTWDDYLLYDRLDSVTHKAERDILLGNFIRSYNKNKGDNNLCKIMKDLYLENPQDFSENMKYYEDNKAIIKELINGNLDVNVDDVVKNEGLVRFLLKSEVLTPRKWINLSKLKELKEKIVKGIIKNQYGEEDGGLIIEKIDFNKINLQDFYRFSIFCRYLLDKKVIVPTFCRYLFSFLCRIILGKYNKVDIKKIVKIVNEIKSDDEIRELINNPYFFTFDLILAFIKQGQNLPLLDNNKLVNPEQVKEIMEKWGNRNYAELARLLDCCSSFPYVIRDVISVLSYSKRKNFNKIKKILIENYKMRFRMKGMKDVFKIVTKISSKIDIIIVLKLIEVYQRPSSFDKNAKNLFKKINKFKDSHAIFMGYRLVSMAQTSEEKEKLNILFDTYLDGKIPVGCFSHYILSENVLLRYGESEKVNELNNENFAFESLYNKEVLYKNEIYLVNDSSYKHLPVGTLCYEGNNLYIIKENSVNKLNLTKEVFDVLFPGESLMDFSQGQIGDCYFLSATYALLNNPEGREKVLNCFSLDNDDNLLISFPEKVPLRFKAVKNENDKIISFELVAYAHDDVGGSLGWKLLEEAYSAVRNGYLNKNESTVDSVDPELYILNIKNTLHAGYPTEVWNLFGFINTHIIYPTRSRDKNLSVSLLDYLNKNGVISCSSKILSDDQEIEAERLGIAPHHAYALVTVEKNENGDISKIFLVNPHNTICYFVLTPDQFDTYFDAIYYCDVAS